jgi:hypothetical protein
MYKDEGVSKSFRTESITKSTKITNINIRWEAKQRVMAAKLTRMTHKIAIQLHLVAESCTSCSFRSRRPVWKLLVTHSFMEPKYGPIQLTQICRFLTYWSGGFKTLLQHYICVGNFVSCPVKFETSRWSGRKVILSLCLTKHQAIKP